ncbi:MAG TPA: SpoIIE family protein phosphatase [Candidatus Acidoferrales bacterium]|nr:SpoIIE family protein phosphatase [Candidatus Acidoferrales bacterium]
MPNINSDTPDWLREMETILEELNEGVVIVDDQLRVIFANEALTRMGHLEREEIRGRTPDAIFPPEDMPHIMRQHESGHRYGRNRDEFYLPRKDGQKIPVIFSGRIIQGPDGQGYSLITVTDISEQKRIEEQLRESNALLEQRQKEIEADLSIAARVQQSLAPHSLVWKDLAVEAYYSPAHKIGGDFGVVLSQGDESLNVIVCDVSGHGVGSALMAGRIYSETLHALERRTAPVALLHRLHEFVSDRLAQEDFYFTMAAARFRQCGHRMSFAAAGHPPAILVSNGTLRLLSSRNAILGRLPELAPSASADEIELARGDRLVLYTDGLVEVFNSCEKMLAIQGLQELIRQSATRSLPEMKQAILDGVAAWSHGPLADDVSLVIVEVR